MPRDTPRTFVVTVMNPTIACTRVMVTVLSRGGGVSSLRFDLTREDGDLGLMMFTVRGGNRNLHAQIENLPDVITLLELDEGGMSDPVGSDATVDLSDDIRQKLTGWLSG